MGDFLIFAPITINLTIIIRMKTKTTRFMLGLVFAGSCPGLAAQQLAFPGAQGWGRFATGGRTGTVYHVTNLNDSGSGSLRDAVSQPNRIVVFDVSGVINISSRIVFAKNLYVAGQTAPGEGITVYGNGVSFSGATNTIVRYMRFRMGRKGDSGKDCAGIANGTDMIFDHCSFSWGQDETFSISPDGKGTPPKNITISNSIIGQGLMTHSAGGLMQSDNITLYRNLYCDNSTRNNKVKGINQYVNNIVYNWKNGAYIMGGDSEGLSYCNIESNLFINGPAVGGAAFTGGNSNFNFYGDDNWQDRNVDGSFNPSVVTDYSASTRHDTPYDYPVLEKWAGNELVEKSLPMVGASLPYRDYVDYYMIDEVMSFGKSGALISNEASLIFGAPDTWTVWAGSKRVDTDGDGMPDEWEKANSTDPAKDDAMAMADNGYVNIENYINSITEANSDSFLRTPMCIELTKATTTTIAFKWRDYTFGEDGFAIEIQKDGVWTEIQRTAAGVTTYQISDLEPGTAYNIRMRAFSADGKYSEYTAETKMTTRPLEVGIIDIDTYVPDFTWSDLVAVWDHYDEGWNNGTAAFEDGKQVLISPTDNAEVYIDEDVAPSATVVDNNADVTMTGEGAIAGDGSLNKAGVGTLKIGNLNKYTGATVIHEGTIEFATLKNGGEPSAIGASVEFAQNWVFDGGTYKYTGGSTSTNRSAKVMSATEFNIANAAATVTMNGALEGTGDFILGGNGRLTVATTGFFKHTGATVLKGGCMYLSTTDISKAGIGSSSKLVFAGGELKTKGESAGYETYSFPIEVVEGTTSEFSPNRNCYLNNKISGAGDLQLNIPYLREYVGFNMDNFSGRLIANGVSSEKQGSLLLFNKGKNNYPGVVVEAKGNARLGYWDTSGTVTLGGLSGDKGTWLSGSSKNTKGFTCTWNVGAANTDEEFAGTINNWSCSGSGYTGTVGITKQGTGDWRLSGSNDYKGATKVQAGRLIVNGTNSGTGSVSVSADATLAGKGTVAGRVTVVNGGTVLAGDTLVNGNTLKLTGGLNVMEGGIVSVPIYSEGDINRANKIKVTGAMTINNGVLHIGTELAKQIPDDQVFVIFDLSGATVSGTGFTSIIPERPSATQHWDTSELLTKGYLYVRAGSTDGISDNVIVGKDKDAPKYSISGRRIVGDANGLYIRNGKKLIGK